LNISDIYLAAEYSLLCDDPVEKALGSIKLFSLWQSLEPEQQQSSVAVPSKSVIRVLDAPGRPEKPELVDARSLPKRGMGSKQGRLGLIHSLAHIEFNAINLALDAVYRFRGMPIEYYDDWLRVASDEGQHFLLLHERLESLESSYGALNAHDGLWDMARQTSHDILVRMALVPRILEARGLDVAPPMIEKLTHVGDLDTAAILERIYRDEITHVEVGNRWFRYICEERELDGTSV